MAAENETSGFEKLSDKNFQVWKFQIVILFKAHDIYDIVSGKEKLDETLDDKKKKEWERKDAKAQKYIVSTIEKTPLMHIVNCTTSKQMFDKLCTIYERDSEQQKYSLLQDFFNIKFEKGSDVVSHISKIENLAYRLKSINQEVDEKMVISKILVTLPEQYKYFISAWESMSSEEKTLTNLTSRLIAEESRCHLEEHKTESLAFKANELAYFQYKKNQNISRYYGNKKSDEKRCFKCNSNTHLANSCSKTFGNNSRQFCRICKKNNHAEKDCFFRPDKNKSKSPGGNKQVSFLSVNTESKTKDVEFVVDSGSSSHMVNDKNLLKNCKEISSQIGLAKKTESMSANSIGVVETKECIFHDVLYIPELSKNLLSVNAITKNGGEVKFFGNKVEVRKSGRKIFEGVKNESGLYCVSMGKNEDEITALAEDFIDDVDIWHRRLGHLGYQNMEKLVSISDGMNISNINKAKKVCEVCLEAKQTRSPFKNERTRASRPLEIIHTDVCGPVDPVTWDGKKYFITFLDDYTHFLMVYLIEGKYEVTDAIKEYVAEVEAKWNYKVSKIRCDNGGEYANKDLSNWCKMKGIMLDYTIPYTPQLNGKAERINRTVMEKTRALLSDSKLPKNMWGEALRTAAYLMNRSPTSTLDTTPAEKWFQKRPDLSKLKIFGSIVYAHVNKPIKKLDSRTEKYILVGYGTNGYRLWDKNMKKIIMSRDVKVIEDCKNESTEPAVNNKDSKTTVVNERCFTDDESSVLEDQQNDVTDDESQDTEDIGRPKRTRKLPERFQDYVMLSYEEAISGEDKEKWKLAIDEEKKSLIKNKTWKPVNPEEAKGKVISCKWVFTVKRDGRYKARLVARGFEQEEGINYQETYSPLVSNAALRIIFGVAAKNKYNINCFDIKSAFLYGKLEEDVYMEVPEGFNYENKILKLQKALYGLKQAPLRWNQHFSNFLKEKGFIQTKCDRCVFKTKDGKMILAIFVDDGILVGSDQGKMEEVLENLKTEFEVKIEKNPKSFLGIEIEKKEEGIMLSQTDYAENVLRKYGMENCKSSEIPIAVGSHEGNEKTSVFPYREAVGSLLYLSNKTRPDLTLAVSLESRHVEKPNSKDIENVKKTLRYLKGTQHLGILYKSNLDNPEEILDVYSDADYAGDEESRRSTTGYVILYEGSPVSWCTRKQPIVSLSTTEAEYIAAADCVKETLYLKNFLQEITDKDVKVNLNIDNQSTIKLIKNANFNRRSKHIEVRYHFLCESVKNENINLFYVPTEYNISDMFTKPLHGPKFNKFKNYLVC